MRQMDGTHPDPKPHERPLGDHVAPDRTGSATQIVNAVSRDMSADVGDWRWPRVVGMAAMIQQERQNAQAPPQPE
jgi:hypothetical protein